MPMECKYQFLILHKLLFYYRKECFSVDNIENEGKKYECNECEYFCMDLALMRKHVKLAHTPGVRFECPQCKLVSSLKRSSFVAYHLATPVLF